MRSTIRERWPEVRELFERAIAVSAPQREAWVEQNAPDSALRRAVLGMLAQESGPTLVNDDTPSPARVAVGESLGRYRVVRTLGEGGMGVVYLAEQAHPKREVAIKLIAGTHDSRALARFKREADVLARLAHPGIASVIEADTDASHRPFLVMEYVAGLPLSAFAANLDRDARLELLAKIAEAMQHAHERGVVHRDLKPSNILVSDDGQPKILDFGIASLSEVGAESLTETGMLLGTPAYMAPEQATGRGPTDARADLYALGVIGYELLVNRLPLPVAGLAPLQALRVVTNDTPPPLSRIDKALAGDLDVIFGKALAKEPELRYASAGAFADDLRRFLANEPIHARRPSTWKRLRLYGRRQPLQLGLAIATLASLVGGVIVSLWFAASAVAQAQRAESTLAALSQMFSAGNPAVAGHVDVTFKEVLASSAKRIADAPPETRVAVLYALGDAQRGMGDIVAALASYAESERLARETRDDRTRLRAAYQRVALISTHGESAEFRRESDALLRDPAVARDPLIRSGLLDLQSREALGNWHDMTAERLAERSRALWPAESDPRDHLLRSEIEVGMLFNRIAVTSLLAGRSDELRRLIGTVQASIPRLAADLGAEHPQVVRLRWFASLQAALQEHSKDAFAGLVREIRDRAPELGPSHPAMLSRYDVALSFSGFATDAAAVDTLHDIAADVAEALPVDSRYRARFADKLSQQGWGARNQRFDAKDFLAMAAAQCPRAGAPDQHCVMLHLDAASRLAEAKRHDEAIEMVRGLIEKTGAQADPAIRYVTYNALSRSLRAQERFEESAVAVDAAVAALMTDPELKEESRDQRLWLAAWNYRPAHCERALALIEPIAERLRSYTWMEPDVYARLFSTCEVRAGRDRVRAIARLDAVWDKNGKDRPLNDLMRAEIVNAYLEVYDVLGDAEQFRRWAAELQRMAAAGLPTTPVLSGRLPWLTRALNLKIDGDAKPKRG